MNAQVAVAFPGNEDILYSFNSVWRTLARSSSLRDLKIIFQDFEELDVEPDGFDQQV